MREQARVVEVADGKVTVEVQRSTTCENCGKCTVGQKNLVVKAKVETDRPVSVGDIVTVEMQTPNLYKATVIMYGIPILMFFIGVALGYFLLAPAFSLDANILGALTGFFLLSVGLLGESGRGLELKGAFDSRIFKNDDRRRLIRGNNGSLVFLKMTGENAFRRSLRRIITCSCAKSSSKNINNIRYIRICTTYSMPCI